MAAATHFLDQVREHWHALKRGRPGQRFVQHYESARTRRSSGTGHRLLLLVAAIVCLAIAIVLSVFPGPAIPFFFLAGGLLATESRAVARLMDWSEVQARRVLAWGKRRWRQCPPVAKVGLVLIAMGCSALVTYTSYRLMRG